MHYVAMTILCRGSVHVSGYCLGFSGGRHCNVFTVMLVSFKG